ncbi:MAG: MFS transporter [Jatrophihabitantaceae bacterium]
MNDAAIDPIRPRRGGLWHHLDFRRLWIGETVSQFGTAISNLALPLVAILVLHASTFQVGLLATFESVAFLLVGLPAGAWVDRMRFRWVLITNDVVRFAALGSIPLAQLLGVLTIGQMYAVALIVSVSTVFFDVAYQSYLPELVDRQALVEGNAKLQASESIAQVAAPSIGGVLIQVLTAPYAVLIDAISFIWSASWIGVIKARVPKPERKPDRHLGREIAEGLRFVLGNRMLRAISICTGSGNFFTSMGFAVFYVLLARNLQLSPGVIGVISSLPAIGGLIGSLTASRIAKRFGQGPTIWISALVFGVPMFIYPYVQRDWTLVLLGAGSIVIWGAGVIYNITQVSFRQGLCPPHLLGRMNATIRFMVWGTMPLGAFAGGALGAAIGVRDTLLVAAIGGMFPWLSVFLSPLRRMRELPSYEELVPTSETISSPVES